MMNQISPVSGSITLEAAERYFEDKKLDDINNQSELANFHNHVIALGDQKTVRLINKGGKKQFKVVNKGGYFRQIWSYYVSGDKKKTLKALTEQFNRIPHSESEPESDRNITGDQDIESRHAEQANAAPRLRDIKDIYSCEDIDNIFEGREMTTEDIQKSVEKDIPIPGIGKIIGLGFKLLLKLILNQVDKEVEKKTGQKINSKALTEGRYLDAANKKEEVKKLINDKIQEITNLNSFSISDDVMNALNRGQISNAKQQLEDQLKELEDQLKDRPEVKQLATKAFLDVLSKNLKEVVGKEAWESIEKEIKTEFEKK